MAFCTKCGEQLRDDAVFCSKCGQKTGASSTIRSKATNTGLNNSKPKPIMFSKTLVLISVFILIAITAIAFVLSQGSNSPMVMDVQHDDADPRTKIGDTTTSTGELTVSPMPKDTTPPSESPDQKQTLHLIDDGVMEKLSADSIYGGDYNGYYLVEGKEDLAAIGTVYPLDGNYLLATNIELLYVWIPIGSTDPRAEVENGDYSEVFTGVFDGGGHTISGLRIYNRSIPLIFPEGSYGVGLFASLNGTVRDLVLSDVSILCDSEAIVAVGAIAGRMFGDALIERCGITDGSITGSRRVGGFVGNYWSNTNSAVIKESFVSVDVKSTMRTTRYGNTNYYYSAGGFVGHAQSNIDFVLCYSIGEIQAELAGGFIGYGVADASFDTCYTAMTLWADSSGLGSAEFYKNHFYGYWTGNVNMAAQSCFTFTRSDDYEINGIVYKLKRDGNQISTFSEWDFTSVWYMNEETGYPGLRWFLNLV